MVATETEWEERWRQARRLCRRDPAAALVLAEELRTDAERADSTLWLARALTVLGSCRWRRGEYEWALRALLGALRMLDEDHLPERADALQELGTTNVYLGEYAVALERLLDALRLRERLDDLAGQGEVLNNLGMVFFHRGELDEAARAYEQSAAIRRRIGDEDGLAGCRNNLAKVLTERGDYDAALEHLAAACRGWEDLGERRGLGMALNNTGIIHERRGDLDIAAHYFEASLALKDADGERHGATESRCHLGRLRARQGALDEAAVLLQRAHDDAVDVGLRQEVARAAEALADLHEQRGDYATALEWHRRFHTAERELFDETSEGRLRGLQVAYQLERAERDSNTDALTGLPNRRYLDRRLREGLLQARSEGSDLAVALCDVDSFKRINDHLGHAVGDAVLREIAALLRDGTRASDAVGRYGGEEFLLVLPACGSGEAVAVAEQLCRRIREHPWTSIQPELEVTVSVGIAAIGENGEGLAVDAEELLGVADRRLYRAKHEGKDRVQG